MLTSLSPSPFGPTTSLITSAHSAKPLFSSSTLVVLPRPHRSIQISLSPSTVAISSYSATRYRTLPSPRKIRTGWPVGEPTSARETVRFRFEGRVKRRVRRGEERRVERACSAAAVDSAEEETEGEEERGGGFGEAVWRGVETEVEGVAERREVEVDWMEDVRESVVETEGESGRLDELLMLCQWESC